MTNPSPVRRLSRPTILSAIAFALAACGSGGAASPSLGLGATASPAAVTNPASAASPQTTAPVPSTNAPSPSVPPGSNPSDASTLEPVGVTTKGDIPDNAVFLKYHGANPAFTIQYVEGWQVTPQTPGVVIRDKDSSEAVAIVAPQADVPGYVASVDLPALQAQPGFKLDKQNNVKVGGSSYVHLVYHLPAPPDPVTGKQVPSTVDRYYVPGPDGLAVVSLSTPDGVDNVDAFRQMIESFRWS